MTIIVILIVLVGLPLLVWWFSAYRDKKEATQRRERLTPLVKKQYGEVTIAIQKEYPSIEFPFPSVESLLDDCQTFRFEFPPRPHIQEVLTPLIDHATEAFLAAPINLDNTNVPDAKEFAVQKGIGDQEFWASESKHRTTKGGGLPSDWSTRREIVHARDKGQCRRCGLEVALGECHIHHLVRKSQGGMHTFDNLITLCRDCHAIMPEHEGMKADMYYQSIGLRVYYYISSTGTIHQEYCQHAHNAKKVSDLYPRLLERGLKPCKKCKPSKIHEDGVEGWTPQIATFVEESIGIYRQKDSNDGYFRD